MPNIISLSYASIHHHHVGFASRCTRNVHVIINHYIIISIDTRHGSFTLHCFLVIHFMPLHTLHLHILILYYICIVHIYTELILQYNLHTPVHSTIYTFTVHICTSYHIRQHISVCIDTCSYSLHTVCINTLLTNIPSTV